MVIYGRGFGFGLEAVDMDDYGPFSGDSRIIHARSIFTMIIPFLWYLHKYITTKKRNYLIPFAFCFVVILLHQHRSVWSSTCVSLFFYFIGTLINKKASVDRFSTLAFGSFIVLLVVGFFISNMFPGFIDFLADRFSEIFDPAKEGSTGNFRIQQRETYFKLFLERPVFGWTFDGFELPNPLVDWWPEKTGQHFHEGYIEMLFYHGVVGLVLKYSFLVYLLYRAFTRNLSEHSIILISFCLAGITFSFNYVLPLVYWGHVGMCLYYIEKDDLKVKTRALANLAKLSASKQQVLN
jgi:O-antigen ligase